MTQQRFPLVPLSSAEDGDFTTNILDTVKNESNVPVLLPHSFMRVRVTLPFGWLMSGDKSSVVHPSSRPWWALLRFILKNYESVKDSKSFAVVAPVGSKVACTCRLLRIVRTQSPQLDGKVSAATGESIIGFELIIEGQQRCRIIDLSADADNILQLAEIEVFHDNSHVNKNVTEQVNKLRTLAQQWIQIIAAENKYLVNIARRGLQTASAGNVADIVAGFLNVPDKRPVLEALDVAERVSLVLSLLEREVGRLNLSKAIDTFAEGTLAKQRHLQQLQKQVKSLQEELGVKDEMSLADDSTASDASELRERLNNAHLPEHVKKVAERELSRFSKMHPAQAEYAVARTYLEWLIEIPWNKRAEGRIELDFALKELNKDHHGIKEVKRRILEYLAVRSRAQKRGPILCFVGSPGVGKSSLARSIASALQRPYFRIALGGARDEADIRGHRRTYVGAMPGVLVQALRHVTVKNPLILLDEIDKVGHDAGRGDIQSALLEVLDPEQNHDFTDRYLGVSVDLSEILFVATANSLENIPGPLLDRLEVIQVSGYTPKEKLSIARHHLIPKQLQQHSLLSKMFQIDDQTLDYLIQWYTNESGVRQLERKIGAICRAIAVEQTKINEGMLDESPLVLGWREHPNDPIVPLHLERILGIKRREELVINDTLPAGTSVGLAYTTSGNGEVLMIESIKVSGSGQLQLTGQLGNVLKESAQAAQSFIRSRAESLGFKEANFDKVDIHIHLPAGAVPKDGPSAGIALLTALVSLWRNEPVKARLAMTGELTLTGRVLPVGGIREKVLAAHRAGVTQVILPHRNEKDLNEIDDDIKSKLKFHLVDDADQVVSIAFDNFKAKL